jgi:S1-C subfamily serine protease
MVNGSGLLLTTAAAVATLGEVALDDQHTGQTDDPLIAQVVAVEQGVALLAPSGSGDAPLDVVGFDAIATADAGDQVIVLGADPVEATYPEAGEALDLGVVGGDDAVDVAALAEGTPVVDTDGALVGLCTMVVADDGGATMHIVPVAALFRAAPTADVESPATDADPAAPGAPGPADQAAWIGVQLSTGTDHIGALIDSIVPQSPADTAGLRVGEVIIAVDGEMVANVADLLAAMATRRVGDVVVLTVLEPTDAAAMASSRMISVLLAAAAPSA